MNKPFDLRGDFARAAPTRPVGPTPVHQRPVYSLAEAPADAAPDVLEALLEGQCHWPLFRDGDAVRLFCGAPVDPAAAEERIYRRYCACHGARAKGATR